MPTGTISCSALIQRANKWLQRRFAELDLVACETLHKKVIFVHDIYVASSSFIMEEDDHPLGSCYVKGLR